MDNRENLLSRNNFSTCLRNMLNFGPLRSVDEFEVSYFRVFASLLRRHRSTEVNKTLNDVQPSAGLVHYI